MTDDALFPLELVHPDLHDAGPRLIAPGAVHIPGWLTAEQQRWIVARFGEWTRGPVPLRAATLPGGHKMSVRTVCLGWHWQPYKYTREATDVNGQPVLDFPEWMVRLGQKAIQAATGVDGGNDSSLSVTASDYTPDAALVNFYDDGAAMGMHQDKDEHSNAPVVSLSIGESCIFRFGNTKTRTKPYTDVQLGSGDLFVFGGPSRFAYHGIPKVLQGTAPEDCGLSRGRINITMRVTGLGEPKQTERKAGAKELP
ncbi:alpha-ketoglutarate-dependent dioxygenase AlkB family protein [Paenarthrobacter ilicis]|uniref:Alkylated DNA repair protein (DNA oxidative demethylase) n=1 Tax=Paenarthrobacter ilicis TaxID=43665 RepID=A0ABX0TLX7_9MICC|nr:alpha-ketoglutarate-dependent dioxygenase AlkB [Paenarthrobacter ilicis]MBM7791458.1 alkylated DNA repair protein (DNA oxidative demethylase) [Paenarthrobacter ilicis]NIJ02726.1 alkylated DNA repair protein (DNA oxidative demethylase) [Paenarthrobacter ilicis]